MASNTSCRYATNVHVVLYLLVTIILVSMSQPAVSDSKQDLFNFICYRVSDMGFCLNFFAQNVFAGATPESLAELTIRKSLDNATSTSILIHRLINSSPKPQQDLYRICDVCFNAITNQLTEASFDYASRDYRSAEADVAKTLRPAIDCHRNVQISPQLNQNSLDMKILIQMTLVILALLPH